MTLEVQPIHDREIAALGPWFHNLHLPDGRQTAPEHPLGDFPAFKWEQLAPALPNDLAGVRALDVGCNAGFYSIQLALRGADVLGIDIEPRYLRQAAWAAERFGVERQIELRQLGVYELDRLAEQFDLVLFLGVLYHLRYPLLGLDLVAQRARDLLVVQTLSLPGDEVVDPPDDVPIDEREKLLQPGWPKAAFVERSLAGDPTNWWIPNRACVEAMLRVAGFDIVERPGHELYVCRPRPDRERPAELDAALGGYSGTGRSA